MHLHTHLKLNLHVTYPVCVKKIFLKKVEHIVCSVPLPQALSFIDNEVDRSQHTRILTLWIHFLTFCTTNMNSLVKALEFAMWS